MTLGRLSTLIALDRDAPSSPARLAVILVSGAVLLLLALWLFAADDVPRDPVAVGSPSPPPSGAPPAVAPAPAPQPTASVSASQLTLHGVSGFGENGAAIISIQGHQRFVRTGRPIAPGIELIAVAADHVVIVERGVETQLAFPEANLAGSRAISSRTPTAGVTTGRQGRRSARADSVEYHQALQPHEPDGRLEGFRLGAGTPPDFATAGLRPGDIIVSVGGTELEGPEDIDRIPRELARGSDVSIEYQRNGKTRTAVVRRR